MTFSKHPTGILAVISTILGTYALTLPAIARVNVVTTIPEIAWVAAEIGGKHVKATSLLEGTENAHYVDAVPEFIRLVANADAVCMVGLDLEIGWLPKVLVKSGNAQVQKGGKGYCDLGRAVKPLEKPRGQVDRSMGHIHPSGNPHYWLAPSRLAKASVIVAETLAGLDPANAAAYMTNHANLTIELKRLEDSLKAKLQKTLAAIPGATSKALAMQYHSDFSYFLDAYGIKSAGSLEEKPGVRPSAGRIAIIAAKTKASDVRVALALKTDPPQTLRKFSQLTNVPVLRLPSHIQPASRSPEVTSYEALQKHYVDAIITKIR